MGGASDEGADPGRHGVAGPGDRPAGAWLPGMRSPAWPAARAAAWPTARTSLWRTGDRPGAYDAVRREWDAVVEVSWQPGLVRGALAALGDRAAHWTYVSSISVYAESAGPPEVTESRRGPARRRIWTRSTASCTARRRWPARLASAEHVGDRLLVARAGLIGGPGDHTDRTGYWVARAARDQRGPMLVPDSPDQPTQVVDVRDLASWLVAAAVGGDRRHLRRGRAGRSVGGLDRLARQVGGHTGQMSSAPTRTGCSSTASAHGRARSRCRSGSRPATRAGPAQPQPAAGLRHRPRAELMTDLLDWEREQGLDRRAEGRPDGRREQELLAPQLIS